jgi:SAM-dependent methyltransferase
VAKDGAGAALERWLPVLARAWRETNLKREVHPRREPRPRQQTNSALGIESAQRGDGLSRLEIEAVGAALLRLQRGLTGERPLAGAPYMDDPNLLGAYLLYYWPVSYLEVALALAELGLSPRHVLDLGSGPGPAAAAILDAGATRLVLADASGRALDLARCIFRERAPSLKTIELDLESAADEDFGAVRSGEGEAAFDLVVFGHCLNELWRGRSDRGELRVRLLARAADLLGPSGVLLVVEPALLATSRESLALRDALSASGYAILGPCPAATDGPYPCPILAAGSDRTCHAEAAWLPPSPIAALARVAGLDRRSVKFTWFAARRPTHGRSARDPTDLFVDDTVPKMRATAAAGRKVQGEAALRAIGPGASRGRVVSDPMLNKAGRVRYMLCSGGRLVTLSAAKDSPEARRSGFLSLRRGDRIDVTGAEARPGGGLGLIATTKMELLERAPTP